MPIMTQNSKAKLMCGEKKVAKMYCQGDVIYSSGNIVTYVVDTAVSYQEEVDEGESILSPKTFSPKKSGWQFVGWRQNTDANGSVLSSKAMGDDPVTLYAVFSQTITLSYNGNGNTGGSTAAQTGIRYYNNNNVINPTFALRENGFTRTDYKFIKWAFGSATGTQYAAGATVTLSSNGTFYAVYEQVLVSISFVEAGVTTKVKYSKGATVNRSSTPPSGATFDGWSASSTGTNPVKSFTATSDATYYRVITYGNISDSLSFPAHTGQSYSKTISGITTSKYKNAYITLTQDFKPSAGHSISVTGCGLGLTNAAGGTETATQSITSNGSILMQGSSGPSSTISIVVYGKAAVG